VEKMTAKMTPSYVLTTEPKRPAFGLLVLGNLRIGEAYMPSEVLEAYPSWGKMQAQDVVRLTVKGNEFGKERHFVELLTGSLLP
jgi:hypothetical protein